MGAVRQITKSFRPGETVVSAGIYSARHHSKCSGETQLVLLKGENFPACDCCDGQVQYQLLRAAPYLHDDEDFRNR